MTIHGKTEKMSVTLPEALVSELRSQIPRGEVSAFFTEALKYYLAFQKQQLAIEKGFGVWSDDNHPSLITSEDSVKYVSSLREADNQRLKRFRGTRDR